MHVLSPIESTVQAVDSGAQHWSRSIALKQFSMSRLTSAKLGLRWSKHSTVGAHILRPPRTPTPTWNGMSAAAYLSFY